MSRVLLAIVLLVSVPLAASADDASAAREAFARGKRLVDQRSFVEAISAFEQAYRLRPHFMVQCSIGRCYENLNKPMEAARHLKRCLDEGAGTSKLADEIQKSHSKMKTRICRITVSSPGKGGTVFVNGRDKGAAPATLELNPGSYLVEVRREGAQPATATVRLLAGEQRDLPLVPADIAATQPSTQPGPVTPSRGLSPVWFWTTAAVTAALAITTTVLGVQTLKLKSDYEEQPTQEGSDDFWQRRKLTNIFLATTLAAAGTGTVLFFFTDFGSREEKESLSALTMGFGVTGRF